MKWISDHVVEHLRQVTDLPDFEGTRYRIIGPLARGGMGVVYEAEDLALKRRVALKVLSAGMRHEVEVIASLEHPGIVPVHDVGELPDGRIYYAMKLVRGRTLAEAPAGTNADRLRIIARVCEAVAFAHANGVVHRDLKPQNVMLGEFGEALVMDWGLAIRAGASESPAVAGTPGFMAPEQQRGEPIGPTADVYSLGVMLRGLLQPPVPKPLTAICGKATSELPRDRYPTASEMEADILRFLDGAPVVAYRESTLERIARWLSRNKVPLGLVATYIAARALVFFLFHR